MLQSLVVTLREGVEAALVIGIALAYLNKSGRSHLSRVVYAALAAAVLASVVGALVLVRAGINQEAFEGWVLLAAASFVASLIYWMHRTARTVKRRIEERLEAISSQQSASTLGIFLFVFLMVFREGVETVLMLSAVSLNTSDLLDFSGAVIGLAVAVIFGILFVRGTVRLDLRKFFQVTTIILFCVVAQLVITGLHELSEAGVLPSSRWEMALIGPIVSNDIFFFVTILALAAWMVLFDWRARQRTIAAPAPQTSDAERRKQLWAAQRERLWTAAVCASSFVFILLITAEYLYAKNQTALSPAQSLRAIAGAVRIPVASVSDGNLHRFTYEGPEGNVRFIVVRTGDRLATALDACTICGPQGYYQNGSAIFCKNCSAAIFPPTIGLPGGCNPVPLPSSVEGSDLLIRVSDLTAGTALFSGG
ncbi:MAG TPA: Fe-S-containing protein [Terriglobia bacterium]|jgi:FTR1 family protein